SNEPVRVFDGDHHPALPLCHDLHISKVCWGSTSRGLSAIPVGHVLMKLLGVQQQPNKLFI
ncbi:hypothetical protein U2088_15400, partial [Listeria monocytogenes]|uniref:hypothetical protein n=1 Tax=Listeria monocytogenes TaxID=1639 RepID=UPI002FDC38EE